jgi:hypothetical protein
MKYKIYATIVAPMGGITLLFARGQEIKLDAKGGEFSKADEVLLNAYKTKDGKWGDSCYLTSLVRSGRLEIIGDKFFEGLFKKDLPSITESKTPKKTAETSGDLLARIQALETDYLRLKTAEEEREKGAAQIESSEGK